MKIYVSEAVARELETGKRAYSRKLPTTTEDYARMRKAEIKRRRRLLARAR